MRNHKSGCAHSDLVMEYVYKELEESERGRFESHLGSCTGCPEEIAALTSMSGAIGEWKAVDFDAFETPDCAIRGRTPAVAANEINQPNSSLLTRIRGVFGGAPLIWQTASALAALLLTAGLVWMFFSAANKDELADKNSAPQQINEKSIGDKSVLAVENNSVTDAKSIQEEPRVPQDPEELEKTVLAGNDNAGNVVPKRVGRKKVRAARAGKSNPVRPPSKRKLPVKAPSKNLDKSTPTVERLTELATADDIEDESLRLTELFAIADSDER